jgi:hypothetical protein
MGDTVIPKVHWVAAIRKVQVNTNHITSAESPRELKNSLIELLIDCAVVESSDTILSSWMLLYGAMKITYDQKFWLGCKALQ